jgi:hypothetical protein
VHPDILDPQLHTLFDNLVCHPRAGENKDSVHLFGNRVEIRITHIVFIGGHPGVHSIDLITTFLELFVDEITACIALIRNANHGNLLLGEKVLYEIIEFFHEISPLTKNRSQAAPINSYTKA